MRLVTAFVIIAVVWLNPAAASPEKRLDRKLNRLDLGTAEQQALLFDCPQGEIPTSKSDQVFCGIVPVPDFDATNYLPDIQNGISNVWVIPDFQTRRGSLTLGNLLNLNKLPIEVKAIFVGPDSSAVAARIYDIPAGGVERFTEILQLVPFLPTPRSLGDVRWVVLASTRPFIVSGKTSRLTNRLDIGASYSVPAIPINCMMPVGVEFACDLVVE